MRLYHEEHQSLWSISEIEGGAQIQWRKKLYTTQQKVDCPDGELTDPPMGVDRANPELPFKQSMRGLWSDYDQRCEVMSLKTIDDDLETFKRISVANTAPRSGIWQSRSIMKSIPSLDMS